DNIAVHSDDALNSPKIVPVTLTVVVNQEPSFILTCDDVTLLEGQPFVCALTAQDPESSAVTITWNGEPSGASFVDNGDGTANFSFTPDYSDVDSVYSAIFSVSDQLSSVADTLYIDVDNRQLIVQSMEPSPGQDNDILISDSIQIQFNEPIDEASLVTNLVFSSAKGATLNYEYVPQQHYLLIGAATGHLIPLDTIGVTLNAAILDLAGYSLDQTYVETFVTGAAVYPGDANDNGIVDERDILPLGLYWGNTGPARGSVPDLTWAMAPAHVAFQGERWEPLRGVFADADGSGVVEANDICGITDNWTLTHTIAEDGKNDDGISLVTSLDGVDESVLQALYQAVLTCPESQGRNILRESLEAALGQPAAEATLPTTVELYQNYPNPFNPFTTIRFYLPSGGRATLSIYNMLGQRVATLIDDHVNAGSMEATWDATDDADHAVASGIYFYRLETTDFSETRRMMLLK
ncbi:MAG: T9SS type A sorting domain-containing protein, partial [candidate division Zixibacteria bacterium]|nr:T9SS type A sorting domain-containing protein [candidate division Zixibacteria bacterium]